MQIFQDIVSQLFPIWVLFWLVLIIYQSTSTIISAACPTKRCSFVKGVHTELILARYNFICILKHCQTLPYQSSKMSWMLMACPRGETSIPFYGHQSFCCKITVTKNTQPAWINLNNKLAQNLLIKIAFYRTWEITNIEICYNSHNKKFIFR